MGQAGFPHSPWWGARAGLGQQIRQFADVREQVRRPGPAEPAPAARVAEHADDEPGPGPPGGQDAAFTGGDHGHVPHITGAEPEQRGEDEVRPGESPGHIVRAQDQVGTLPPVEVIHDEAERGPGQRR